MRSAVVAAVACLAAAACHAQTARRDVDCSRWLDQKGFSADYIKLRTGKRQRGTVDGWRGNVAAKDVRAGDVVMTHIKDKGQRLRASYVEEVHADADGSVAGIVVSEWNEGKYVDEACFVTDHFGRDSGRRAIGVDSVVRAWRPSLPLRGEPLE